MPSTLLVCGAREEKTEELLWRSGTFCCVDLLDCCDFLLNLWRFGAINTAVDHAIISVYRICIYDAI